MKIETKDFMWRMQAFDAAVKEQLVSEPVLDKNELLTRARQIYNWGVEKNIFNWEPPKVEEETKEVEEKKEDKSSLAEKTESKEGYMPCPKCGEQVRATWKKHMYKEDNTLCGYVFE